MVEGPALDVEIRRLLQQSHEPVGCPPDPGLTKPLVVEGHRQHLEYVAGGAQPGEHLGGGRGTLEGMHGERAVGLLEPPGPFDRVVEHDRRLGPGSGGRSAGRAAVGIDGRGETTRESRVRAAIAVRVKQGLPNGDLFVEGTKVVLVNDEELHIYISGVIRPEDIEPDNSVRSSLVADAEIELTGRGALTDNQDRGWLVKLLDALNPV